MTAFAVLFDLDGTLVDSIELLVQSMEFAFDDRTRRPPRDEWVAAIGTPSMRCSRAGPTATPTSRTSRRAIASTSSRIMMR